MTRRSAIASGRGGHELLGPHVRDPPDQLLVEVTADHRRNPQRLVGLLAEAVETAADHLADALRDLQLRRAAAAGQLALAGEQPDDLADEERVAVGLLLDGLGQSRRRRGARGHLDVALDGADRQPLQRDAPTALDAGDLAEHPGERMVAAELDVAVGAEDQQATRGELASREAEQEQRRLIRPMQVVEHEHDRPIAGRRRAAGW